MKNDITSSSVTASIILILGVCILLRVLDQGESVFLLRNFNIVGFYYLFNCATCFGHTTIFMHTYFLRTYSIDNGSVVFLCLKMVV
jgi:hypothetical protein